MKIHEYQAKELFRKYGVPVPKGIAAARARRGAEAAAQKLIAETGSEVVVVKAQIHAGGRGKGGGVKVVKGAAAAQKAADEILGMTLVTHQTGPEGKKVQRLLVEQGLAIARELYLALVVDRATRRVAVMASTEGGMEIEEVAAKTPEKILTVCVDPAVGLQPYQARKLAFGLGPARRRAQGARQAARRRCTEVFVKEDCSLVEINPLVVTKDGHVLALDAQDQLRRQRRCSATRSGPSCATCREEEPAELEAKAAGLSYITLDGNIGCLVNGAGLAMATMDIIKHYGGEPANFLDVGGGADQGAGHHGVQDHPDVDPT